jgi:hypothetical protein
MPDALLFGLLGGLVGVLVGGATVAVLFRRGSRGYRNSRAPGGRLRASDEQKVLLVQSQAQLRESFAGHPTTRCSEP